MPPPAPKPNQRIGDQRVPSANKLMVDDNIQLQRTLNSIFTAQKTIMDNVSAKQEEFQTKMETGLAELFESLPEERKMIQFSKAFKKFMEVQQVSNMKVLQYVQQLTAVQAKPTLVPTSATINKTQPQTTTPQEYKNGVLGIMSNKDQPRDDVRTVTGLMEKILKYHRKNGFSGKSPFMNLKPATPLDIKTDEKRIKKLVEKQNIPTLNKMPSRNIDQKNLNNITKGIWGLRRRMGSLEQLSEDLSGIVEFIKKRNFSVSFMRDEIEELTLKYRERLAYNQTLSTTEKEKEFKEARSIENERSYWEKVFHRPDKKKSSLLKRKELEDRTRGSTGSSWLWRFLKNPRLMYRYGRRYASSMLRTIGGWFSPIVAGIAAIPALMGMSVTGAFAAAPLTVIALATGTAAIAGAAGYYWGKLTNQVKVFKDEYSKPQGWQDELGDMLSWTYLKSRKLIGLDKSPELSKHDEWTIKQMKKYNTEKDSIYKNLRAMDMNMTKEDAATKSQSIVSEKYFKKDLNTGKLKLKSELDIAEENGLEIIKTPDVKNGGIDREHSRLEREMKGDRTKLNDSLKKISTEEEKNQQRKKNGLDRIKKETIGKEQEMKKQQDKPAPKVKEPPKPKSSLSGTAPSLPPEYLNRNVISGKTSSGLESLTLPSGFKEVKVVQKPGEGRVGESTPIQNIIDSKKSGNDFMGKLRPEFKTINSTQEKENKAGAGNLTYVSTIEILTKQQKEEADLMNLIISRLSGTATLFPDLLGDLGKRYQDSLANVQKSNVTIVQNGGSPTIPNRRIGLQPSAGYALS